MASVASSSSYAVPTLKYYFSATTFQDVSHSRASSRPSSSGSNSSDTPPRSAPSASRPHFEFPRSTSNSQPNTPCPPSASPLQDNMSRASRLSRPLPTPPTTPQQTRLSLRPLPNPPVVHTAAKNPLPTPPDSASRTPPPEPVASSSALPAPPSETPISFSTSNSPPPAPYTSERPSIRLHIPTRPTASAVKFPTPLSPVAFDMPGPKDLRKRREDELARQMRELGFVESPRTHKPNASVSSVESNDSDCDVVLLVDQEREPDEVEGETRCPTRSESRQAMLTLFSDDEVEDMALGVCALQPVSEMTGADVGVEEPASEVRVEVVTQEAVARTKRRYSRKWIRERRGKRWTERDFSEIISQLRKLR